MIVSYGTDKGLVRSNNQDSVFVKQYSDKCGLFVVADGMGGHRGGKTASSYAVEIIGKTLDEQIRNNLTPNEIKKLMITSVEKANTFIFDKANSDAELNGMGTTVVCMYITDNMLYTASVGDSRGYVLKGNRVYQITNDHSLVAGLVSKGLLSPDEAKTHPQKNVITRAVGTEINVLVDFFETALDKDDLVVACTDGLHTLVDEGEICTISCSCPEDSAQNLIKLANEKGGNDNISVIVVKIS